jgi:hypothetical protein
MADLRNSELTGANLSEAVLVNANLSKSLLSVADLRNSFLIQADMSGANLILANLNSARLLRTNLSGALMDGANLDSACYEVLAGCQPIISTFSSPTNLDKMRYESSPSALVELRNAFKVAGMREQEREVTYAIRHCARIIEGGIEGTLQYVFFELTCGYGLAPWRPLLVLVFLVLAFAAVYSRVLWCKGRARIWKVWPHDRIDRIEGQDNPQIIGGRWWTLLFYAIYYSLLSAFNIGWRELNVGNWIARLQVREYSLRGTGWVRSVSGFQSLISLYLLALWALSYFGRPFE